MKLSKIIEELEVRMIELGDVDVWSVYNDGQATYSVEPSPSVRETVIWPNHPDGRRYYITV